MDEEYMRLNTHGEMMCDPIYEQISYNFCDSYPFMLKLRHSHNDILVDMKRATGREIAKHVIRPANTIPATHVTARCAQLLVIIDNIGRF